MIAIYGIILATVAAIWTGIQINQSRRRLRIEAGITLDLARIPYKTMFVKVTNLNKRPIQVQSINFYKDRKDYLKRGLTAVRILSPVTWRKTLQEGDSVVAQFKDYKELCSGKYGYIFVLDSVGRRWPLSRKIKRNLKRATSGPDKLPMPTITEITEK